MTPDTILPRAEYPRPTFVRSDWLNLNGQWAFEIDAGDSGFERGLVQRELKDTILVPYCPESTLSSLGYTDFMNAVWYRRKVTIPASWAGRHPLLHFQAVDYDATIWVNGAEVGRHRGGFTPITVDLKGIAHAGEPITIVVRARDDHRAPKPRGKQSSLYGNHGCEYIRTTGIWQTVWMEPVADVSLLRPRITPDLANQRFLLQQPISGRQPGLVLKATLSDEDGAVCTASCRADQDLAPVLDLPIPADRYHLWEPGSPNLYDLEITLADADGQVVDQAASYAGLRSVTIEGQQVKLNGKNLFQRLVLDQGFYPDGILTAPADADLVRDIELSQAAGFNGARLHQKVFEERFLYHADKMGYLVWGEFPDWGCGGFGPRDNHQQQSATYITQWLEAIQRDYSHPSIIGWCPLNETWQPISDNITPLDDATRGMFLATKAMDPTRPVLDSSGYSHRVPEADIYDSHDYDQKPDSFAKRHAGLADGKPYINDSEGQPVSLPYAGQPYFVSEFGGIWWNPKAKPGEDSWGYGDRPKSLDEFYQRFEGLCNALLDDVHMFAYCYTQLTDVFQEQNGIYTFNRESKFDVARLAKIQTRQAAIEKLKP
jgi:beta-galactosidase/beta-glucuronidase